MFIINGNISETKRMVLLSIAVASIIVSLFPAFCVVILVPILKEALLCAWDNKFLPLAVDVIFYFQYAWLIIPAIGLSLVWLLVQNRIRSGLASAMILANMAISAGAFVIFAYCFVDGLSKIIIKMNIPR